MRSHGRASTKLCSRPTKPMPSLRPEDSGRSLEYLLTFAHTRYADRGLAKIEHNGTMGRFIKQTGKLTMVPAAGGSAPDYYGSVNGRMLAFDAKRVHTQGGWHLHRDRLHQFHKLQSWARIGQAVSFFAIEEARNSRLWLLRVTGEENPFELPGLRFNTEPGSGLLQMPMNPEGWYDYLPILIQAWLT